MYAVAATVHSVVMCTLICTSAFSALFASLTMRFERPQGSKNSINVNDTKTDVIKYGITLSQFAILYSSFVASYS